MSSPAVSTLRPGIFDSLTPLPTNIFPKRIAPKVPNSIPRKPSLCLFLIVSLTHFINKLDYALDLTIFMTSSIFSFEIINVGMRGPKVFFRIAASVANAATVNPNGSKTLLALV